MLLTNSQFKPTVLSWHDMAYQADQGAGREAPVTEPNRLSALAILRQLWV
jgi:hypothetical protein